MSSETSKVSSLPRWDVSEYFPAVDSPEFRAAVEALAARVTHVRERVDALGIRRQDSVPVTPETVAAFDEVTTDLNGIGDDTRILGSYLHAFISTDARDTVAPAAFTARAVAMSCSSLSTEHGPAMMAKWFPPMRTPPASTTGIAAGGMS